MTRSVTFRRFFDYPVSSCRHWVFGDSIGRDSFSCGSVMFGKIQQFDKFEKQAGQREV